MVHCFKMAKHFRTNGSKNSKFEITNVQDVIVYNIEGKNY